MKQSPLLLIGIVVSADGLSGLEDFFKALRDGSDCSFIIIQQQTDSIENNLHKLLVSCTNLPIYKIEDGLHLEANSIYIAPPDQLVSLTEKRFHLEASPASSFAPINFFFESIVDWRERAVGVILSLDFEDGAEGIQAISQVGGLTLAVTPHTSQFATIQEIASNIDFCDYKSTPSKMPELILDYAKEFSNKDSLDISETLKTNIFTLIKNTHGIDFNQYKVGTMNRRLKRRIELANLDSPDSYYAFLQKESSEIDLLVNDLLIGMTDFFRDPEVFNYLETEILPSLFRNAKEDGIRIWVTACAMGQEAYTYAILLYQIAQKINYRGKITIFATDVNKPSLAIASLGIYEPTQLSNLSNEQKENYFFYDINTDLYRIKPEIRQLITFAPHDLLLDPPFTRMDFVSCRNVLIYLKPDAHEHILSLLNFALKMNGFLCLGGSEGLGRLSSTFASEHSNYRVYRKTKESRFSPEFRNTRSFSIPSIYPYDWNQSSNQTTTIDRDLLQDYDLLLNRFIPPSVILNDQGQVLQYIGNVSRFLKLPSGRTENNILEMVDGDIYIAVSLLLSRARNKEPNLKAILVKLPDGDRVEVRVEVLIHKNNPSIHYHLFFSTEKFPWNESTVLPLKTNPELQRRLFELETELQVGIVKERALVEQAQITNEELLATNEELQSANEELRSVNEELHTVNSEFENQNFALNQLNLDHEQLLKSLQVGVLFLDESQRIRKFNSAAAEIFQLLPQDIGRPLAHFSFQLEGSGNVPMDAIDAMKSGIPVEREVQSRDGKWWLKRAAPYFHSSGQIRGTVVSYTDITNIKNTEEALRRSEAKFQAAIKHSSLIFAQTDKDLRYTWIYNPNPDFNSESMIGKSDIDISDNVGTRQLLQLKKEVLETGKGIQREIRFPFLNGYQTYTIIAEPLLDTSGQITGVATCSLDITDRKQSEDALLESEAKYRNLVNNLNDGVVAHSADTSIQVCNEAACTILGLTMDQMLGKVAIDPTWKFVSEQGTPMDLSEYPVNQVLAKRKPIQNFILGVYRPINSDFAWLLCNGFPVFKNNGEIDQVIINFIDITERKQAEDALRESENRFRVLFENSPIGMAMIDSNTGQFITSNSHYYEMLGYTSEEFQNLSFKDLTHMEDLQMDLDNMERLKRGEIQEFTMEKRYYHKNGSLIWVTLTVVPLWRMGDTPKYHIATVNNITEKKAREGLLQFIARRGWHSTKENFLDSIAQYLGEILNIDYVLIDRLKDEMTAETVALYAKGRIVPNIQYSLLGTPCENVIGKEFCHYRSEIQRLFPKDSLLKDMKAESYLGVPLWDSDGNPIGLIAVLDSKPMNDFQLAQTLLELVAVRVSGEIQRMEYLDVLKKSEERQRLVADTTLDAYYDWDMITNQVWRNQGYKNLYGEPTGNNLIWWKTHIHSDDYERLFKSMANAFSEQKSTWSSEYRFLRNSGDFAYVLDRGRIFYNEKGKPIRFIGAIIDLTERLQFEDELKKAKWSAEKANNAKSEFLANISHELRTPLNGILGFAQTLKLIAEHVSPVILDGLRIIENSGNHLLRLINDILDLSKIEASKIELSLNPVMITDLLEKIIDIVKQNAIEKGLDLKLDIATDLPTIVITDEKYLIQILLNLLGNAIKFTEKGEITLKVSRNGEKILFALIDTGIGIPQDKLEEVFNPFQQLNNSSKFEGTGLGLSISQRLVQSMGGKIQVESKPGSGTKFWFEFDLPNEKANLEKFELSEDLINQYDGTNKRILIIDDDEINRMVMRAMLLPLGFEVIEAEDGKIGIEKVQVFKPDLIFMDYRMPGQNGLETTILIRQMILEIQPKIIMCSATALKELREKSLEMGCNDCITKPIKLKDVLNCLQSNLNQ